MRPRVIRLPACPVPDYRPRTKPMVSLGMVAALGALASCTTLGTNIRGSFSCGAATGGSCAPSTVIDDKALAEITGDVSFRADSSERRSVRQTGYRPAAYTASGPATALPQKILRIVFPAHVDALGRFHETAVVQAVVDGGQWVAATDGHGQGLTTSNTLNVSPEILSQLGEPSLADADRPLQAASNGSSATPAGVPSVAAVAAARARARVPSTATTTRDVVAPTPPVATPGNRPATFVPPVED